MENEDYTPLSWASNLGQDAVVVLLIQAGANVNLVDRQLHTPIDRAVEGGHASVVDRLLENSAKPITGRETLLIVVAAEMGHIRIVQRLLRILPTDIEQRKKWLDEAFNFSLVSKSTEISLELLRNGANPRPFFQLISLYTKNISNDQLRIARLIFSIRRQILDIVQALSRQSSPLGE